MNGQMNKANPPEYWVSFADQKGRHIKIEAGTGSIWHFCFVCGSRPIQKGGKVTIFCEVPKFWLGVNLQSNDQDAIWYCHVEGNVPARIVNLQVNWKALNWVTIELPEGAVCGDKIEFLCGTDKYPSYTIAHKYNNALVSFKVDFENDSKFTKLWPPIRIDVIPGSVSKINIIAPSIVEYGDKFNIKIRGEDVNSNIGTGCGKNIILNLQRLEDPTVNMCKELALNDDGTAEWKDVPAIGQGIYRVVGKLANKPSVVALSNPIVCIEHANNKIYWGDCHCHTGWCDGSGSCEENITFARDKAFLDVFGFSEHLFSNEEFFSGPTVDKGGSDWAYIGPMMAETSDRFNKQGSFVTILGYEYTPRKGLKEPSGDHCVFSPCSEWSDMPMARELPDLLLLAQEMGSLVIPHVGGNTPKWDKIKFNPAATPLVEIASMHGRFEHFAQAGLQKGYKIGFCGMSDGHFGSPGYDCWALHGRTKNLTQRNYSVQSAITAFLAPELSREAIFEAMKSRRTYATTGERIILSVDVNGHAMGDEFSTAEDPVIKVKVHGTKPISRIDLIRGTKRIKTWEFLPGEMDIAVGYEDDKPLHGTTYYYLRIIQEDFAIAWSSPVWVNYFGSKVIFEKDIELLPPWNDGPDWPNENMGAPIGKEHIESLSKILKRRDIYKRFGDFQPIGIFEENRGKFSFFRGYDVNDGTKVQILHYFEFVDERINITPGWSPYGQVNY